MAGAVPAGADEPGLAVEIAGSVDGGAEISTFEPRSGRLFVTTGDAGVGVEVYAVGADGSLALEATLTLGPVTSVDSHDGMVVAAVVAENKTDPGTVVFVDSETLEVTDIVTVGALPDMVTFTPDGRHVLTANEGEPEGYLPGQVDPEGSISVISLRGPDGTLTPARHARFHRFNAKADELRAAGVRIYGPGASVAQDLEPEYIAVSDDSTTAYVTLQENNALAIVDIRSARVLDVIPLGYKDWSTGPGLDASDQDGVDGNLKNWPVFGMYQPDAIAFHAGYLFTANEGDAREWDGLEEEARVRDLDLDPLAFPQAGLQDVDQLGRLTVTTTLGDADGDGVYDELYTLGGRSMSVWDSAGNLVWDSGQLVEEVAYANGTWVDGRSDNKGPEPEGVVVGSIGGVPHAFLGLERTNEILIFDVSDPESPRYVQSILAPQDVVSPEGLEFVDAEDSPTGSALLIVTYEVSQTIVVYRLG